MVIHVFDFHSEMISFQICVEFSLKSREPWNINFQLIPQTDFCYNDAIFILMQFIRGQGKSIHLLKLK